MAEERAKSDRVKSKDDPVAAVLNEAENTFSMLAVDSFPRFVKSKQARALNLEGSDLAGITDAEAAFRFIDADGGGTISYEELLAAVRKLGLGGTEADCKRMMLQADKDGNGEVDLDEFLAWQVQVAQENAAVE